MLPQKEGSHVHVVLVRRAQWVLCQVLRPLVVLKNRNVRHTKPRNNKTPHIPLEHRQLIGTFLSETFFVLNFLNLLNFHICEMCLEIRRRSVITCEILQPQTKWKN